MLLKAVKNNNIEDVKKALLNGEDINVQDEDGYTALLLASQSGNTEIVKLLLENPEKTNIDVNIQNKDGDTALIWAFRLPFQEDMEIIKLLLENPEKTNIDVNIKNKDGDTALMYASMFGYTEKIRLLLEYSRNQQIPEKMIDFNIQGCNKNTALIYASILGYKDIVELFLENLEETKIDINIQTNGGTTALSWASFCGHIEIVKLLLKNNADIHIKSSDGYILMCADNHPEIAKLFLKYRKIKLYDVLKYSQIKEILRRHSVNPSEFLRQPKKEVKYYDKRF